MNITKSHCDELYYTLKGLAKKIELKEKLLFESIGLPHRSRRQVKTLAALAKAAQILFGICDFNCITNSNKKINEMQSTGLKETKILENRVKILEIDQERESENIATNIEAVYELKTWTDEMKIRNRILQHFVRINILLNQYTFETNTLCEIIQLAKIGQIHPSLFTKQELINQLRDIKVSVPSGTDLPIDIEKGDPYELLGLSNVIIYYSDNKIVFKINIPLVYQHILTLYHLIPKPVCILNNCIYIKTSYNFLAVSRSKELYATYDEHEPLKCKRAHEFLLCPEINPIHPKLSRPICEISLIQDPQEVPSNCELMQFKLDTSIYHKLTYKNKWLYITKGENIFITCNKEAQSMNHRLNGVGVISLNETCKGFSERDILIPGEINHLEEYTDFIPTSRIPHLEEHLRSQIEETGSQNKYIKNNQIYNLNEIAKPVGYFQNKKEMDQNHRNYIEVQRNNGYLLYVITIIILIAISIFWIKKINGIITKRNTNRVQNDEESIQLQATAPTIEPSELVPIGGGTDENNLALYPKLRTVF